MIEKQKWQIYLLECADKTFYAGVTTDIDRRLQEHNHCNKKGAKYTRCRRPVKLVYLETADTRSLAQKKECQLKKLTKSQKLKLIKQSRP